MFLLLYQPPCGEWYVHSHKLYPSEEVARRKAEKFLPAGTPIAIVPIGDTQIEDRVETVG